MPKVKDLKEYAITHKDGKIILHTDLTKSTSLEIIVRCIFNEMLKQPDGLNELMVRWNRLYFDLLQERENKAARKENRPPQEMPTKPEAIRNHWTEVERLYRAKRSNG